MKKILGLERVLDYGYASIHQISATTFIGLVDETKGMPQPGLPKTVTLSFITTEVDGWYQYLTDHQVPLQHSLADATRHPTRGFVALDPEGYFLEFETFFIACSKRKNCRPNWEKNDSFLSRECPNRRAPPTI